MALPQDNLKRRLAFSTVSQVGYIYLGFGLMDENGLAGALFYLASHAAIKSVLFLSAGAMISATGKKKISEMAGIGRKMPLTAASFTAASLGLIGIPMFSGFVGKWYLIAGSLDTGDFLPTVIIIAGSVLCAAYLFPVIRVAWFERPQEAKQESTAQQMKDPGAAQKLALILLTAVIFILGIVPGPFIALAKSAAAELLMLR